MKKIALLLISILILSTLMGCGPTENNKALDQNEMVATAVKQTDDARMLLTQQAAVETEDVQEPTQVSDPTEIPPTEIPPTAEPTTIPSPTPIPPTPTSSAPCLKMMFIDDVTIADNTWVNPGDTFTKTWRIRNTGSCTWNSSYKIEFDYGAQMDAPVSFSVPETVFPGHDVDISVELSGPMTAGTYIGNFKIKSDNGIYFGTFYVQVYVPIPELADFNGETLEISQNQLGSVDAVGNVSTTYAYAGDTADDQRIQAFFSFDLSDIPDSATINAAYLLTPSYTISGSPYDVLGCLRVYSGPFFSLGAGDYGTGEYEFIQYCEAAAQSSSMFSSALTAQVKDSLVGDKIELQMFFYQTQSDDNGEGDYVAFSDVRLMIYYTP